MRHYYIIDRDVWTYFQVPPRSLNNNVLSLKIGGAEARHLCLPSVRTRLID